MKRNEISDTKFDEHEKTIELKLRSYLFVSLQEAIKNSENTQAEIAEIIGTDQPKVSKIINGKFDEVSIERMCEYLQKLGYDIHIAVSPAPAERSGITVYGHNRIF